MPLLLGQLVYTSFAGTGFKLLASAQTPAEIQQAFQRVVFKYWDSYNPPESDYRATYLHQVTAEQTLFGWLYSDGADDMGRDHVPYLICYYLGAPLLEGQLKGIFTCLSKGPVAVVDRQSLPVSLEAVHVPNLWSYQPARPGVKIPLNIQQHSYGALKQQELLDLFVSNELEIVTEPQQLTDEQQPEDSINSPYFIEGLEVDITPQPRDVTSTEAEVIRSLREYQERLQQYEQVLVRAIQREYPVSSHARNELRRLQQVLELEDEDIEPVEARVFQKAVLAYGTSQLLLGASIAITALALIASTYGLLQTSSFAPSRNDLVVQCPKPDDPSPKPVVSILWIYCGFTNY